MATYKPRIAICGGMPKDYAQIHDAVKDVADMRYVDSPEKARNLKNLISNGGSVILWTTFAEHGFDDVMNSAGITFRRNSGNLNQLIEEVKRVAYNKAHK